MVRRGLEEKFNQPQRYAFELLDSFKEIGVSDATYRAVLCDMSQILGYTSSKEMEQDLRKYNTTQGNLPNVDYIDVKQLSLWGNKDDK